jgi:hypothetical protein
MIGAAVLQIARTGFHSHLIGGEARRILADGLPIAISVTILQTTMLRNMAAEA